MSENPSRPQGRPAVNNTPWVLATSNEGKLKEFNARFAAAGIQFRPQGDFGLRGVDETGSTFIENALLKARAAAAASGLPALADDSGLRVPALGGAPGVHSARYAGPEASDEDNNHKLLRALQECSSRDAEFCCALVLLRSPEDPLPVIAQATWKGRINETARGEGGFGYDPLFMVDGLNQTSAQLPAAEKNRISHRGQAIDQLLARLTCEPLF